MVAPSQVYFYVSLCPNLFQAVFITPAGAVIQAFILPDRHFVSGSLTGKGTYVTSLIVPKWNTESGIYFLQYVLLVDLNQESVFVDRASLQKSGFPAR